ncbi:shikimate dehydrogenase [Alkaliphilus sp. B6464]|uniref:shikimate dehydrogenase n=1 Tax=Alkaliphilus sp. B6464 TaxID=2731219 RepID=UPI001BA88877|nr:shikimate dehydrogenase [Alkaliphilus sp. B6464]QUH20669.1 shikimate dehydrogenase [Alkaliphilus sp. B6464]
MITISGKTKTVALIGDPVEHSFSPFIHNYGFQTHKLNMIYVNHIVKKHYLKEAIEGIRALEYVGVNVTYPHKIEVINYLDEVSKEARLIGAVNTIKNENGKLIGYNTDGSGFIYGLAQDGIEIKNKTICLFGAGGSAKSIAISLCLKADCEVIICNRNIEKAEEILYIVNNNNKNFLGKVTQVVTPNDLKLENVDILVNCTPVGMGKLKGLVPFEDKLKLHKNMIVYDLIYNPYETPLLKVARSQGLTTYNGLNMLVGQAILAFEIWTGKILNFDEIKRIIQKL